MTYLRWFSHAILAGLVAILIASSFPSDVAAQRSHGDAHSNVGRGAPSAGETGDYEEKHSLAGTWAEGMIQVDCWSCTFVNTVLVAADSFAREAYHTLAQALVSPNGGLLKWLFLCWIALQVTKLFFPGIADEPGKVLKALVMKSFLWVIVFAMLWPQGSDSNYSPMAGGSGQEVNDVKNLYYGNIFFQLFPYTAIEVGGGAGKTLAMTFPAMNTNDGFAPAGDDQACGKPSREIYPLANMGVGIQGLDHTSEGVRAVLCQVHHMQTLSSAGMTTAFYMLAQVQSAHRDSNVQVKAVGGWFGIGTAFNKFLSWGVSVLFIIVGAAMLGFIFAIALIAIPFYFIDVIIRLFLVSAFAPVLILATLFKPTRGMTVTAVKLMFGACMNLVGMAMVFGLSSTMMNFAPHFVTKKGSDETFTTLPGLIRAMADGEVGGLFTLASTGFWIFLMSGILILVLMKKVSSMVSGVFGDNANFGTNMGTAAQGLAGGVAKIGAMGAAAVTGGAAVAGGAAALGAGKGALGGLANSGKALMARFGRNADLNLSE